MKKILISLSLALPILAQAQFQGIDSLSIKDLPIGTKESQALLNNAITGGDIEFVKKWDKEIGLSKPYDSSNKDYCRVVFTKGEYRPISLNTDSFARFENELGNQSAQSLAISRDYSYFTHCDHLTLFHIINEFTRNSSSEEESILMSSEKDLNSPAVKFAPILLKEVEKIQGNQWELLFPVIQTNKIPSEIRLLAARKLVELYPNRDKDALKEQKDFWKSGPEFKKNNLTYAQRYETYNLLLNPLQYHYDAAFQRLITNTTHVETEQDTLGKLLTKDFFLGKKKLTIDDFKKLDLNKNYIVIAHQIKVEKEIMDILSQSNFVKPSAQDDNGNTILHKLWTTTPIHTGNRVSANLIRAMFEQGFNPMMLNQKNETIYGLFQSRMNETMPQYSKPIDEAFKLKEYNY